MSFLFSKEDVSGSWKVFCVELLLSTSSKGISARDSHIGFENIYRLNAIVEDDIFEQWKERWIKFSERSQFSAVTLRVCQTPVSIKMQVN